MKKLLPWKQHELEQNDEIFQPHENPRRRVNPRNSCPIKEIREHIIKDSQKCNCRTGDIDADWRRL